MIKLLILLPLIILLVGSFKLAPSQISYNLSVSKQLQKYCIMMHCSRSLLQAWSCKLCPQVTKLQQRLYIDNNLTNVVLLMGYHPDLNAVVMVFRGTEDAKNWLEDFSYLQVPYIRCKDCKVHAGFYAAYLSVQQQINQYIIKIRQKYQNVHIYATGSSLGASIATIAALQMQIQHGNVTELHVFGCPRTGDVNFARYLTQKVKSIRRVIHNRDIVPHVPLINQNYHHPAYEIWFDQDMNTYKICNDSGEDPNCSSSLYPNYSILDHISYWQKLDPLNVC